MRAASAAFGLLPSAAASLAVVAWPSAPGWAAVATDGSVGPARGLSGPTYLITPDLGRRRGGNLFHSFARFDLDRGETAAFAGPADVRNVLARVTGGRASAIDGTIRCDIAGADVYLINPAGVVFGPDATLDVRGSFVATTADVVRLADGGAFHAAVSGDSVLTTAAPAAFGFLAPRPTAVTVNGTPGGGGSAVGGLVVGPGKTLAIVAGEVHIVGGRLAAGGPAGGNAGGRVVLVAAAGSGVDVALADAPAPGPAAGGPVDLAAGARVSADGGGSVVVRGGSLSITDARVTARAGPGQSAGGVDVAVAGDVAVTRGAIDTSSVGAGGGDAGPIRVAAGGAVALDGDGAGSPFLDADPLADRTGLLAFAGTPGPAGAAERARGGAVDVSAASLDVRGGALVTSSTFTSGPAGAITVAVSGDVRVADPLNAGDFPDLSNDGTKNVRESRDSGLIASSRTAPGRPGGRGGDITITAGGGVSLGQNGKVGAGTTSDGRGGDVTITAAGVDLQSGLGTGAARRGARRLIGTSIGAGTGRPGDLQAAGGIGNAGDAGDVTIKIPGGALTMAGGAIAATTGSRSAGRAGRIDITADRADLTAEAGIRARSDTESTGPAGSIMVDVAGRLSMDNLAGIDVKSATTGAAGRIDVRAGDLVMDGRAAIRSVADRGDSGGSRATNGNGGTVTVEAGTATLSGGARVSADTSTPGDAGRVRVIVGGRLTVATGAVIGSSVGLTDDSGRPVPPGVATGRGGDVFVQAAELELVDGGHVQASTTAEGRSGSVTVVAGTIRLAGAGGEGAADVSAASMPGDGIVVPGRAGDVTADATTVRIGRGGAVTSAAAGTAAGGTVTIRAAGRLAVAGGSVSTKSDAAGGEVVMSAGPPGLFLTDGAVVSAEARERGNIDIADPRLVVLRGSRITARVTTAGGGQITVGPSLRSAPAAVGGPPGDSPPANPPAGGDGPFRVVMSGSVMNGLASRGRDVPVRIDPAAAFLRSADSQILSDATVIPVETDISGSLVALPPPRVGRNAVLAPQCGARLGGVVSTFVLTGRGGQPPGPGGWATDWGADGILAPPVGPVGDGGNLPRRP